MKKTFFAWLILFGFVSLSFAQEKIITENEFNDILAKTAEQLKTANYRLTKTEQLFLKPGEKPEKVRIEINEYIRPNKWREVVKEESKDKSSVNERLWDGKNLYVRENDGMWQIYAGGDVINQSIRTGQFTKTFKFVEKSKLNEQVVNIYDVEIKRVANKFTQTSFYQVAYFEKSRYWISEDNFLLKKKVENTISGSEAIAAEDWVYEYNPQDLIIEAPIK